MRILMELTALRNQTIDSNQYHKLQGFIYGKLIDRSPFRNIHDLKGYKYYCYSNIFPPSPAIMGEKRFLIFSSPDQDLINFIFYILKEFIENKSDIDIGSQSYRIYAVKMLKKINRYKKRTLVTTSTPITIRISEKAYKKYYIPTEFRKSKFIYWRSNLSVVTLIKLLEDNIKKKYENFCHTKLDWDLPLIDEFQLLREIVVHIPISNSTLKLPASFWNISFDISDKKRLDIFNFILDCGLGERNSYGFGFLNPKNDYEFQIIKEVYSKL